MNDKKVKQKKTKGQRKWLRSKRLCALTLIKDECK